LQILFGFMTIINERAYLYKMANMYICYNAIIYFYSDTVIIYMMI